MSRTFRPTRVEGRLGGFIYLAANPAMPGIVRAGRTQVWPHDRIKQLYSASVPEPFVSRCSKFFVDCFLAEEKILRDLALAGIQCTNRNFFEIDEKTAIAIVETHYSKQHTHQQLCAYQAEAETAFALAIKEDRPDLWQRIINTFRNLPIKEREKQLASLLPMALELGSQECAKWLISNQGVDPDIPLGHIHVDKGIPLYSLTAYETAIFLANESLEKHLEGIGCNLSNSKALCWTVDCLMNWNGYGMENEIIVQFGVELLKRQVNVDQVLDVTLFADAPWRYRSKPQRLDIFPRNSGKTCREVIEMYAYLHPQFAELHKAMYLSCIS